MEYFQARLFLAYLLLTILMELPVLWLLLRRCSAGGQDGVSLSRIVAAGFLASFASYPYLWYVVPALIANRSLALVGGELFVAGVETLVYRAVLPLSWRRAMIVSLVCNLTTIVFGSLMNKIIVQYRLFL